MLSKLLCIKITATLLSIFSLKCRVLLLLPPLESSLAQVQNAAVALDSGLRRIRNKIPPSGRRWSTEIASLTSIGTRTGAIQGRKNAPPVTEIMSPFSRSFLSSIYRTLLFILTLTRTPFFHSTWSNFFPSCKNPFSISGLSLKYLFYLVLRH